MKGNMVGLDLEAFRNKRKELLNARASLSKWKEKAGSMALSQSAKRYIEKQEHHIQEIEQELKDSWTTTKT